MDNIVVPCFLLTMYMVIKDYQKHWSMHCLGQSTRETSCLLSDAVRRLRRHLLTKANLEERVLFVTVNK